MKWKLFDAAYAFLAISLCTPAVQAMDNQRTNQGLQNVMLAMFQRLDQEIPQQMQQVRERTQENPLFGVQVGYQMARLVGIQCSKSLIEHANEVLEKAQESAATPSEDKVYTVRSKVRELSQLLDQISHVTGGEAVQMTLEQMLEQSRGLQNAHDQLRAALKDFKEALKKQ